MTEKRYYQLKLKDGRVFRLPRDTTRPQEVLRSLLDTDFAWDGKGFVEVMHSKGEIMVAIDQIAWMEMPDGTWAELTKEIRKEKERRQKMYEEERKKYEDDPDSP